jgi:hypothetical protein
MPRAAKKPIPTRAERLFEINIIIADLQAELATLEQQAEIEQRVRELPNGTQLKFQPVVKGKPKGEPVDGAVGARREVLPEGAAEGAVPVVEYCVYVPRADNFGYDQYVVESSSILEILQGE